MQHCETQMIFESFDSKNNNDNDGSNSNSNGKC